jgi:hypothetical protein
MNIVTAHLIIEEPIKEVNNDKKFVTGKIVNGIFIEEIYSPDIIFRVDINGDDYEGKLKNGKRHGFGKCTYVNGDYYEGNFINDQPNGKGIIKLIDGNIYDGYFKNNKYEGYGKYYFSNGDSYDGYFKNEKYEGYGKYYFNNGNSQEGYFKDGKANGMIKVFSISTGNLVNIEFKNDIRVNNCSIM